MARFEGTKQNMPVELNAKPKKGTKEKNPYTPAAKKFLLWGEDPRKKKNREKGGVFFRPNYEKKTTRGDDHNNYKTKVQSPRKKKVPLDFSINRQVEERWEKRQAFKRKKILYRFDEKRGTPFFFFYRKEGGGGIRLKGPPPFQQEKKNSVFLGRRKNEKLPPLPGARRRLTTEKRCGSLSSRFEGSKKLFW